MKQTVMLKKNYEFKIVLTKGRFYIGKQLKIVILKNGKNFKTLGIAVSTKNGKAFQRNKAKRLIREAYKNLEEKIINGYSIVVLLKKDIDDKIFKKISPQCEKINFIGGKYGYFYVIQDADSATLAKNLRGFISK